jgi:ketosteroid isomerase-like protein
MMDDRPGAATLARYEQAYRRGDAAGCAACFHADATLHSAFGPPAQGRAAIEALHRDWVQDGAGKTLEIVEHGAEGGLAWAWVRFAEGAETGVGWSLAVMVRDGAGGWLIRAVSLTAGEE